MKSLYVDNELWRILYLQAASFISKKAAFTRLAPLQYRDVPEPEIPNPRWLKVKNIGCGLCGSDINLMYMNIDPKVFPAATPGIARKFLGHEMVGKVVEAGSEVTDVAVGDRVCLRIDWPSCYQMEIDPMCPQCQKGAYMQCRNLGAVDPPIPNTGGGFSPYMVMHRTQPFKVPAELSDDQAVLLEPLACAVHGVYKRMPEKGERVLVVGCGTIGLLTVAAAKAMQPEAEVMALARYPFQAAMAKKLGADDVIIGEKNPHRAVAEKTDARYIEGPLKNKILIGGFDVVYDTVGKDQSIHDALRWIRSNGSLVILGINLKPGKIDYTPVWHQEIRVTGTNCHANEAENVTSFDLALSLIMEKRVSLDGMVTHHLPMERYRDAVDLFLGKGGAGAIKIILDHET